MNDNDPADPTTEELRGENEALRRVLLELIETLPARTQNAIKARIAAFVPPDDEDGSPRRDAYAETMGWFVRHVGR